MKNNRNLLVGVVLLFTGIIGLNGLLSRTGLFMGGMMQGMTGAQLPFGIGPDALPEATSDGARLLGYFCTQCHELPGPGMHTAEEWPRVITRMNQRMQVMSNQGMMRIMHGIKTPSDAELQVLTTYLQKNARQTIDETQYTDLNSPAGTTFSVTCSQCHALPDPQQHTADEWPGVVERMTQNMEIMGKTVPSRKILETIVAYLQKHAT